MIKPEVIQPEEIQPSQETSKSKIEKFVLPIKDYKINQDK